MSTSEKAKTSFHVTIRITSFSGSADRLPPPWQRPAPMGLFHSSIHAKTCQYKKKPEDIPSSGSFYPYALFTYCLET